MPNAASYLRELLARGGITIPPYPSVALKIQQRLRQTDYSMTDLAELVKSDPSLAARVLGVANSAVHRPATGAIASLEAAVNRIGSTQVSELALAACLAEGACKEGALVHLRFLTWRRSLTSAFIAQKLAKHAGLPEGEAFLGGLLHDFSLGVALANLETGLEKGGVERAQAFSYLQAAEEHRVALARVICDGWNLPPVIRQLLGADPLQVEHRPLVALTQRASRTAELVDTLPLLTEQALLPSIPEQGERRLLVSWLPGLPDAIVALGSEAVQTPPSRSPTSVRGMLAVPGPVSLKSPASSRGPGVAQAPAPPGAPELDLLLRTRQYLGLDCQVEHKGKMVTLALILDEDPQTLLAETEALLQENWLAHVSLSLDGKAQGFWMRVETCEREGRHFLVRLVPYGLNPEAKQRLDQLLHHGKERASLPPPHRAQALSLILR